MSGEFYEGIKGFRDFRGITQMRNYHAPPPDWHVVVTDIEGSTQAITDGRYRDVNTLGAAAIVLSRKAMKGRDFPFVFGGDGSTILVPPESRNAVLDQLYGLKRISQHQFNLTLRVGVVEIAELQARGHEIEIAKYEETPGQPIAILRGNGISIAEQWIKQHPAQYQPAADIDAAIEPDLDGLSCRWQPIPEQRGRIISLLIQSRDHRADSYAEILNAIESVLPDGIAGHNPVDVHSLSYKTIAQCLRDERRYHSRLLSLAFMKRVFEVVFAVLAFRFHVPVFGYESRKYVRSLPFHTDFRKFDDMLRMTLDCSQQQVEALRAMLQEWRRSGRVYYGIFEADQTLMTCFVEGLGEGEHFHFVDADNGGYAIAAIGLKRQIQDDNITNP